MHDLSTPGCHSRPLLLWSENWKSQLAVTPTCLRECQWVLGESSLLEHQLLSSSSPSPALLSCTWNTSQDAAERKGKPKRRASRFLLAICGMQALHGGMHGYCCRTTFRRGFPEFSREENRLRDRKSQVHGHSVARLECPCP